MQERRLDSKAEISSIIPNALCPLDDRYKDLLERTGISSCLSEYAYVKNRTEIEYEYLKKISLKLNLLSSEEFAQTFENSQFLFEYKDYFEIKKIEERTNHDVNSIIEFLRNKYPNLKNYVHFGLTSQDANSLGFMIGFRKSLDIMFVYIDMLEKSIEGLIKKSRNIVICAKTHAQPAIPTYLDKELYVKYIKIREISQDIKNRLFRGLTAKMGGAVGTLCAHHLVYPEINWNEFMNEFVSNYGFARSEFTTQIDNYNSITNILTSINQMLLNIEDLNQYCYSLISDNYFCQKYSSEHVGSSTMPQKINPIELEFSRGSNSLVRGIIFGMNEHLSCRITYQRDISDSYVLRNMGMVFGNVLLILIKMSNGIDKLYPNLTQINRDLDMNPTIIMEGVQTYMKILGIEDPYSKAKDFSRGKNITLENIHEFIDLYVKDEKHSTRLKNVSPHNYVCPPFELTFYHDE